MATLLLKDAMVIATMNDTDDELKDASVFIRDGVIEAVGPAAELPDQADDVINMQGHVLIPGMVNTHHHLFQNLTRFNIKAIQTKIILIRYYQTVIFRLVTVIMISIKVGIIIFQMPMRNY